HAVHALAELLAALTDLGPLLGSQVSAGHRVSTPERRHLRGEPLPDRADPFGVPCLDLLEAGDLVGGETELRSVMEDGGGGAGPAAPWSRVRSLAGAGCLRPADGGRCDECGCDEGVDDPAHFDNLLNSGGSVGRIARPASISGYTRGRRTVGGGGPLARPGRPAQNGGGDPFRDERTGGRCVWPAQNPVGGAHGRR